MASDAVPRYDPDALEGRQPPLSDITEMGKDARVLRSCDIFFATFCCKPFSQAGLCKGINDPQYGNNLQLLIDTLRERRKRGVLDKCLIIENVPTLLRSNIAMEAYVNQVF